MASNNEFNLSFTAEEIDERLGKMTDGYIEEKVLEMMISAGIVLPYCDNDDAVFVL